MQLIGADAAQRRKRPSQDVIEAAVLPRFFDGHDVVRLFDDADRLSITRGPRAVEAWINIGDVIAHRAEPHVHLGVADRIGQRQGFLGLSAQNMKREALRRLGPYPGQMFELVDQTLDGFGKIRHEDCSVTEWGGPEE